MRKSVKGTKKSKATISFEVENQFKSGGHFYESEDDDDYVSSSVENELSRITGKNKGMYEKARREEMESESDSESEEEDDEEESESESEEEEEKSKKKKKKTNGKAYNYSKVKNASTASKPSLKSSNTIQANKSNDATAFEPKPRLEKHIVEDDLSPEFKKKLDKVMSGYEGVNAFFIVAPNWHEGKAGYPVSGFTLVADANSKINPICFDPIKMCSGTAVVEITGAKFNDGRKIDLESLITNKDRIAAILNTKFDGSASRFTPPSIEVLSQKSETDQKEWHPTIQEDTGGFISLDYTVGRSPSGNTKNYRYWARIKTGSTLASENFFQYIQDSCDDGEKTWHDVFGKSTASGMANLISRNRDKLLYSVLDSIGLDMSSIKAEKKEDTKAFKKGMLLVPDAESVTNKVTFKNNTALFTRGTILVDKINKPIVFNENPLVGSWILNGPNCSIDKPYGNSWGVSYSGNNLSTCAYPVDTGKVSSKPSSETRFQIENQYFTWKGMKEGQMHKRLSPDLYRARDKKFMQKEADLGRDHSWGQIELSPLITKLSEEH